MEQLRLVRPSEEHKMQYEAMMDEWESYGGRINPGALRRTNKVNPKAVTYEKWLKWKEEDREAGQDLFFFMREDYILGAISIRFKKNAQNVGIDGHSGYGIRPSERQKGYATAMLAMALPIMKEYGINPVVISCDKENIGSAKTILNNGGRLVEEVVEPGTDEIVQIYHIWENKDYDT